MLAVIVVLGLYAWRFDEATWEVRVIRWLQGSELPGLRPVSIGLTVAGNGVPWMGLIGLLAAVLWLLGTLRLVLLLGLTAALQDIGAVLKLLVERARPSDTSVIVWRHISSHSFPSGHVLGATLVFGFLFFAVEHCSISAPLKRLLQAVCVLWILLMGLARMALGAHWPTDVLGGYLIGAFLLLPIVFVLRCASPVSTDRHAAPSAVRE